MELSLSVGRQNFKQMSIISKDNSWSLQTNKYTCKLGPGYSKSG